MNWKEVKENCPTAFQEFRIKEKQIEADHGEAMDLFRVTDRYNRDYYPRDLYDHFDGFEIYLSIELGLTTEDERVFYPIIYSNDKIIYGYNEGDYLSDCRVKSETRGFEKLFEIREKQLTEGEQLNE